MLFTYEPIRIEGKFFIVQDFWSESGKVRWLPSTPIETLHQLDQKRHIFEFRSAIFFSHKRGEEEYIHFYFLTQ